MANVKFLNEISENGRNECSQKTGAAQQIENSIQAESATFGKKATKEYANSLVDNFDIAQKAVKRWCEKNTLEVNGKNTNTLFNEFLTFGAENVYLYEILDIKSSSFADDKSKLIESGYKEQNLPEIGFKYFVKSVNLNTVSVSYIEIINSFFNYIEVQKKERKNSEYKANQGIYKELISLGVPEILANSFTLGKAKEYLSLLKGAK